MKKISNRVIILAFLSFGVLSFAQKAKNTGAGKKLAKTSSTVKTNQNAELEAKNKIAAEEKAKLPKPYDTKADAGKDIQNLIEKAQKEKKNIMIQAGGNWCIWCLRFNDFVQTTPELKLLVDENYEYYHLNYSPDNKNEKVFAAYGDPGEKYGYPVFIVLDSQGKMIHTQQSDVLEDGKGYSKEKVTEFFTKWMPNQ